MNAKALLAEARDLTRRKEHRQAESLLREILFKDPDNIPALDLLGFVLYFLNRTEEAEEICQKTLRLSPAHAYALKGLGLCLARRGMTDQAVATIEQAIARKPDWFDPYWDLAVTLVDAGRHAEAVAVVRRARAALPEREAEWQRMDRHARSSGAKALVKQPNLGASGPKGQREPG